MDGIDSRVQHNIDVAKDRISEYLAIKNKDRRERIQMLREIYSDIIPKPAEQEQEQEQLSVHNYTISYWLSVSLLCRITKYVMQQCFPSDGKLIDDVLNQLLNHHEEYHRTLLSSQGNISNYDIKEAEDAEDRKLGYTLFTTLNVSEKTL